MQTVVINQQIFFSTFIINLTDEGKKRINVLHPDGLGEAIQSYA